MRSAPATWWGSPASRPGTTSGSAERPGWRWRPARGRRATRALHRGPDARRGPPAHPRRGPPDQGRADPRRRDRSGLGTGGRCAPRRGAVLAAANGPGTGSQNIATYGQYAPGLDLQDRVRRWRCYVPGSPRSPRWRARPRSWWTGSGSATTATTRAAGSAGSPCARPWRTRATPPSSRRADRLDEGDLAAAAGSLGLGVDHDLGFPAYFGQVPAPESETEAAADLIGQGKVLASPDGDGRGRRLGAVPARPSCRGWSRASARTRDPPSPSPVRRRGPCGG